MKPLTLSKGLPLIRMGLLGVPGSGKTPTLATLAADPRLAPALWLDCGGNMEWVKRSGLIPYGVGLERADDLDEVVEFLAMGQPANHMVRTALGVDKDIIFKTVVLDTANRWQALALEELRQQKLEALIKKSGAARPSSDQLRKLRQLAEIDPLRDASPIAERTRRTLVSLVGLSLNVFVTFHEDERLTVMAGEDGRGVGAVSKSIRPLFFGKTIGEVLGLLNLVGRIRTAKEVEDRTVGNKVVKVEKPYSTITWSSDDMMVKNQVSPLVLGRETKFYYDQNQGQTITVILDHIQEECAG